MVLVLWKRAWLYLTALNMYLPYNRAVALLVIYPREMKTCEGSHTNILMFIAALFVIAKYWKQPKCPLVSECLSKLWYIETMEQYLAIKRNKLLIQLKGIMFSEQSKSQKAAYSEILFLWHSGRCKTIAMETGSVVARVVGGREEHQEGVCCTVDLFFVLCWWLYKLRFIGLNTQKCECCCI